GLAYTLVLKLLLARGEIDGTGAEPVLDRGVAVPGGITGDAGGAVGGKELVRAGVALHVIAAELVGPLGVSHRDLLGAFDHDGLEPLGAHDGADTGTTPGAAVIVDDGRYQT